MNKSEKLLVEHYQRYPKIQIRDIFKFCYQSSFGCEHMVSSLEKATDYIQEEYDNGVTEFEIEELDGDYCRVPLSYINNGLSVKTFGKLFYLSAKKEEKGKAALLKKLQIAQKLVEENKLPFNLTDFLEEKKVWEEKGFPAIHHSEIFRKNYKPVYRLISKKYVPFLPLFAELDKRLEKGPLKMAIEGRSASGKSSLADIIESIYICTVLHMDDFFLQPHQRTPERFNEIGGNVDRERFLKEVLIPLSKGEKIHYRPFDCSTMQIKEGEEIISQKLTVIEGAYSMHPDLAPYYDFSVFLDISPDLQKQRILKRNGQNLAKRFFEEWIPLENKYFEYFKIKDNCDIVITVE